MITWVFPVKIKSIKPMFLDELENVINELSPGFSVVHQSTVLVPLTVVPASDGEGHLHSSLF